MYRFWVFITILSIFLPAVIPEAQAQEVLTAQVISLDPDHGMMVVQPVKPQNNSEQITVYYTPDHAPKRLSTTDIIRIKGRWSTNHADRFTALHIGYGRNAPDPTGVRSRIGKCRGQGRSHHGQSQGMGRSWAD